MMTVITTVQVKEGCEADWDSLMAERLGSAADHDGFVDGRILHPVDVRSGRVILGTWESQADWEAWHADPAFVEDRSRLDTLQESDGVTIWYEVGTNRSSLRPGETLRTALDEAKSVFTGAINRLRRSRTVGGRDHD